MRFGDWKMAVDFKYLEWVRTLMSEKSTSNFVMGCGVSEYDRSDASGCLAYINLSYKGNDKALMKTAVDCYIGMESKQKLSEKLAGVANVSYTPKKAKKYAEKMGELVANELVGRSLSDREKAGFLGVCKSTYSEFHSDIFDDVFDVGFCALSSADDLAGEYLRKHRRA